MAWGRGKVHVFDFIQWQDLKRTRFSLIERWFPFRVFPMIITCLIIEDFLENAQKVCKCLVLELTILSLGFGPHR